MQAIAQPMIYVRKHNVLRVGIQEFQTQKWQDYTQSTLARNLLHTAALLRVYRKCSNGRFCQRRGNRRRLDVKQWRF